MPIVVNEGPFGNYVDGAANTNDNIDKMIELFTPSSESAKKLAAEPDFSLPDEEVCRLVRQELLAIKAANHS